MIVPIAIMDHTKLHRPNQKSDMIDKRQKRRSVASTLQKKQRSDAVNKRRNKPISPLKDSSNKEKKSGMREKLQKWREERDLKRKMEKANAKPVFKTSSAIARNENLFSVRENTKRELPKRNTRSTRQAATKQAVGKKKEEKSSKQKKADGGKKKTVQHELKEVKKPDAKNTVANPNESFAPANFSFCPPSGLTRFPFTPMAPLAGSSKDTNFVCSTPFDFVANENLKKPGPIPMMLTSSGTSSDEGATLKQPEGKKASTNNVKDTATSAPKETAAKNSDSGDFSKEIARFREIVKTETELLTRNCQEWEKEMEMTDEVRNEEATGQIRSVIGQAQLLMAERFLQFMQLIDKCETPTPDHNLVNPTDLEGFWEMINFQVLDVKKKFEDLVTLKENNWIKPEEAEKPVTKKKIRATRKKSTKPSPRQQAARKRVQEVREAMRKRMEERKKQDALERIEEEKTNDVLCESSAQDLPGLGSSLYLNSEPIPALSSSDHDELPKPVFEEERRVTRSRKTSKSVAFVSPQSKKRKVRAESEIYDGELKGQKVTPVASQPRKRVMRKTPLPSQRDSLDDDDGVTSNEYEDVHGSPTLGQSAKKPYGGSLATDDVEASSNNQGPMTGLKLNFDDEEEEEESKNKDTKQEECSSSIDQIYLMPSTLERMTPESTGTPDVACKSETTPFEEKYLQPSDRPLDVINSTKQNPSTPLTSGSPSGRVLRSKRKSHMNPFSPFLPKVAKAETSSLSHGNDLMTFSPVAVNKVSNEASNATESVTKSETIQPRKKMRETLGSDTVFSPSPVRRSARLISLLDSTNENAHQEEDKQGESRKQEKGFGHVTSLL